MRYISVIIFSNKALPSVYGEQPIALEKPTFYLRWFDRVRGEVVVFQDGSLINFARTSDSPASTCQVAGTTGSHLYTYGYVRWWKYGYVNIGGI